MNDILANWKQGKGFPGTLVIDGHIHIGDWSHATTFFSVEEAVGESAAYLDANGVDAFCAVSGGYNIGPGADYRRGNDFLLAVWEKLKDRMIPFLSVNPNDTAENIMAELERMYSAGVRCIKLINAYQENYPGDGPNLMALYEFAAEHNMLVFNHGWAENVIRMISAQFPGTDFVLGHYGAVWQAEIMKERDNVHANFWNLGPLGWLERGIEIAGAGKFMAGSDGFLNPLSAGLGPVVFADISDEEKRMILGLNAARLVDKVGALPPAIKKKYSV